MNTFLQQTAKDIVNHYSWEGLRDVTLVFPSRRAGLVLKNELKQLQRAKHPAPVFLPTITTLSELFDTLSPLQEEDELRLICRLFGIYREVTGEQITLDLFYGWGRQIISDFNDIDKAVPQNEVKTFFENTIAARELEQVKLDEETTARLKDLLRQSGARKDYNEESVQAKYDALWRNLYTIYLRLNEQLQSEGKGYEGARMRAALEQIKGLSNSPLRAPQKSRFFGDPAKGENQKSPFKGDLEGLLGGANSSYCFIGFNYLLRVEKELMLWIKDHRQVRFYWDYVADFQTNTKAFAFVEQHIRDLGNAAEPMPWTQPKPIEVIATTTGNAQAQYVAPWLQAHYTKQGERTAVVICDEGMLEPVIYALPALSLGTKSQEPGAKSQEPAPINITKGFPLANTQVYAQMMQVLEQMTIKEVRSEVLSRHVGSRTIGDLSELPRPACGEGGRGRGNTVNDPTLSLATKRSNSQCTHEEILAVLDLLLQTLDEGQSKHTALALSTYEAPLSSQQTNWHTLLLRESVYQLRCAINRFRQLTSDPLLRDAITSLPLLRNLLVHFLSGISLPFNGEPITDIQVMGVLETRMLDFDNLLLLNVEEGVVPQQQADLSFIPYYLRKTYHIPTKDEGALVYAYNFFRLMARAKHVTLLFSEAETAMGRKSMSRFIMQMMVNPRHFTVRKLSLNEAKHSYSDKSESNLISPSSCVLHPSSKESPSSFILHPSSFTSLSPSAINTYIECRRKFYWQYVEHLRQVEPDTLIFASNTLGTFVHRVMQDLYQDRLNTPLDATWLEQTANDTALLTDTLRRAYDEVSQESGVEYHFDRHPMENIVIIEFVKNILRRDKQDAQDHGLTILLTEEKHYFMLDGVKIGGTIDRMDKIGDRVRIVDYKTGAYDAKRLDTTWDELLESPNAHYILQTLIYSEAALHEVPYTEQSGVSYTEFLTRSFLHGAKRSSLHAVSNTHLTPHLYFTQKNLSQTNGMVKIEGTAVENYLDIRSEFLERLQKKVSDIKSDTEFPMAEEDQCKSYCPFRLLCHRDG
ncbi:MAG: PD-(D/E)XK nuclease family protein [Paludibacteraceae bacterium]